jgi:hypothetical protein
VTIPAFADDSLLPPPAWRTATVLHAEPRAPHTIVDTTPVHVALAVMRARVRSAAVPKS